MQVANCLDTGRCIACRPPANPSWSRKCLYQPSTSQPSLPRCPRCPRHRHWELGTSRREGGVSSSLHRLPRPPQDLIEHAKEGKRCTPLQPTPMLWGKVQAGGSGGGAEGGRGDCAGKGGLCGARPVQSCPCDPRACPAPSHVTGRVCFCPSVCLFRNLFGLRCSTPGTHSAVLAQALLTLTPGAFCCPKCAWAPAPQSPS